MEQRSIADLKVSAIGLGGMPMSIEGRPEAGRSVSTIHAALDAGVTLIDTADAYHLNADEVGHNEELIAGALALVGWRPDLGGGRHQGRPPAPRRRLVDAQNGDPAYLKQAARDSARRLGVDAIGLYQFHRPDPKVPYAESVGALVELLDEGVIVRAGISNATVAQIDEANEVLGGRLASVQNQFSPAFRSSRGELEHCAELGIAFLPWSPLGGISKAGDLGSTHDAFAQVAQSHGVSPQQVALAWELSLADVVIPIPGASRPTSIEDSVQAAELRLTDDELARLS